ncbi:hypothetical protein OPV22_023724 [Ensete ventricosum]|uniref:Uncharacterized protein n=1 Tax=Ensete ventricosum TaxID=4639 RepID=A0AAV8QMG8_ENSVE|nr:hypothetical protein OPV22_023724 [Ensete ventricosum]
MERCRWTDLAVAITRQVERDVFSDQSSSALVHRPNRLQIPDSGETPCIRDGHKRVTARHAPGTADIALTRMEQRCSSDPNRTVTG